MAKFAGRRGDLKWGVYQYPVTRTQKATLDGLWYMMSGLPKVNYGTRDEPRWVPEGYFGSQDELTGQVIVGLNHKSVSVHRNGRITANR